MKQDDLNNKQEYNHWYVYTISFIAALGGLMFGFDLGIITGVVPYIEHQFHLSGFSLGIVVAVFELGAMAGAMGTARIADTYGRKKTMIACAFLFIATAVGVAFSPGAFLLGIWRFAQGICVGAASVLSPMYIAEVSPAQTRVKLVSVNQLTIILGIFAASLCNYYFGENDLNSEKWRYMFLSAAIPSTVFFLLLFYIPESPRWLVFRNNTKEAGKIFLKINKGNETFSAGEIVDIQESVRNGTSRSRVSLKVLFGKAFLPVILIGFSIAFLQQFCGINNVTPYLQKIFIMAGIELKEGLLNAVLVQLVFFLATFIAIVLIDKIGRKLLMLAGTGLMGITLLLLALAFHHLSSGIIILVLVMIYIGAFAFTLGPVVWVLISEMYPNEIRGRAIALTSAMLWLATFLVVLVSPYLLNVGPVINFFIFGLLNILGFVFCFKYLPETKGKTLEQMKEVWHKKGYLK